MFYSSYGLTSLELGNFDTSQVTDMSWMFYGCRNLTSLDLSNFKTDQVTDMSWMFYGCRNLISLNLSNFNTSKVKNMSSMFSVCERLTQLDMRNAVFNATSYSYMFSVPNGITVIVKDATAKTWIEARLSDEGITGNVTIASA